MTDNIAAQAVLAPISEAQQIETIKNYLFRSTFKYYQEFSGSVNRLQMDPNLKRIINEKLDDAWLWVKEAFSVLQIELPKIQPSPQVPQEAGGEVTLDSAS